MSNVLGFAKKAVLLYVVLGLPIFIVTTVIGSGSALPLLNGVILFGALYPKLGLRQWLIVTALGVVAVFLAGEFATDPILLALVIGIAALIAGISSKWGLQIAFMLVPLNAAILSTNPAQLSPSERAGLIAAGAVFGAVILGLLKVTAIERPDGLSWNGAVTYGAVLGLAVGIGTYVVTQHGLAHGYWLAVTFLAVMQPSLSDTRSKALLRVGGTVAGAILALLLSPVIPDGTLTIVGFAFLIAWALLNFSEWAKNVLLTVGVVLLVGATEGVQATASLRLVFTVIGGVIALALSFLLPVAIRALGREVRTLEK